MRIVILLVVMLLTSINYILVLPNNNINKYRLDKKDMPISKLLLLSKLFECVICSQLVNHLQ